MPQRHEENGSVSFDWSQEIQHCKWDIEDILARHNPNHPDTLEMIMYEVRGLAKKIDSAWSQERSDSLLKAVNQGTGNMLAGILAMHEIANREKGEE